MHEHLFLRGLRTLLMGIVHMIDSRLNIRVRVDISKATLSPITKDTTMPTQTRDIRLRHHPLGWRLSGVKIANDLGDDLTANIVPGVSSDDTLVATIENEAPGSFKLNTPMDSVPGSTTVLHISAVETGTEDDAVLNVTIDPDAVAVDLEGMTLAPITE